MPQKPAPIVVPDPSLLAGEGGFAVGAFGGDDEVRQTRERFASAGGKLARFFALAGALVFVSAFADKYDISIGTEFALAAAFAFFAAACGALLPLAERFLRARERAGAQVSRFFVDTNVLTLSCILVWRAALATRAQIACAHLRMSCFAAARMAVALRLPHAALTPKLLPTPAAAR